MIITRNNYETYFLDYLEGVLDESLVDEFILFLQNNQDLKTELELARMEGLKPDDVVFQKKNTLYKEKYDLQDELDQTAIARLEGDLTTAEKIDFEKYLTQHPERQKEAALFNLTLLAPDVSVIFEHKRKLYHHSVGKLILLWTSRAAAILVLAFLIYQFPDYFSSENNLPNNQLVVTEIQPDKEKSTPENPRNKTISKPEPAEEKYEKTSPEVKTETHTHQAEILKDDLYAHSENEKNTETRIPMEIPKMITGIEPFISTQQPDLTLVEITIKSQEKQIMTGDERLLADVVKEKTGINNFSLSVIARAGLYLVSSVSNEKFNYQTNSEGEIIELNYDSRLLAFTIPTKIN